MQGKRRNLPFQSGKPCKVAIKSDPLASRFDREGCEPGIADARSARVGSDAQLLEDVPVSLARLHDLAMRLREKIFAEPEGLVRGAWSSVGARICGDANYSAQCERGQSKTRIAGYDLDKP